MKRKDLALWMALAMGALLRAQPAAPNAVTLEQAIQEAMANNLDLAAEKWNISVAEARAISARLRPNPVLSVSGMTLNLLGARFTPESPLGPNQVNVHTDFPLERSGKRAGRIALAGQDKTLAELGVQEVLRQVIANVQNSFVDVQQAKENLKLAQGNLKSLEDLVKINQARHTAGDLALVELDRSRVAALQYSTAVQQAQLQLDQAKVRLQQAMGRVEKRGDFDVAGELRRDAVSLPQPEIVQRALDRRPDYLATQQVQARSRTDLTLQLANRKVDYVLGTEYTYQRAYAFGGSSLGFSVSVPLPVFNKNQGEIARAEREGQLAAARIRALRSNIATEVDQAYRQYTVSRQLLNNVEADMLTRARTVRDTMEYSYRRGEASLVEFLDAQRAFNDAMQIFNDARASYARSLYLIDTVSGATVQGGSAQ